jgi:crossover junction endodeoxyribonuclease RusA
MTNLVTAGTSGNDITGTSTHFFVKGRPIPQGSLKFINGHAIHVRAQDLALWRADIANTARSVILEKAQEGVEVNLTFVLAKPKTVTRKEPHIRPDIDKLVRAVLDGLTDVAYRDDEQVVKLSASKEYGETQGVWIRIIDRAKLSSTLFNAKVAIEDGFNGYSD